MTMLLFSILSMAALARGLMPIFDRNQVFQSKYFDVRLEDFHAADSATYGVYSGLHGVELDTLLDDESVPPDVYYHGVFANLRNVAPNISTISINGGFKYRPENAQVAQIQHEIQHIHSSLKTLVAEAHRAGIKVAEIKLEAILYFPEKIVAASNYMATIRKHFRVTRVDGPQVQCKVLIENTPVEIWIVMEEEQHWRITGVNRTPFHGRGKRDYGVQKKFEALYHLEDFYYEGVVKERRATRFLLFSPVNMFGAEPQAFYARAARNFKALSQNADQIRMLGGGYVVPTTNTVGELAGELRLLQANLFAAVRALQAQGVRVEGCLLRMFYNYGAAFANSLGGLLATTFGAPPQRLSADGFAVVFMLGATPVRVEVALTLPADYAAQVDAQARRSVIEVLPPHLQFDSLFERIYRKKTVMQQNCVPTTSARQVVFNTCAVKLLMPQQSIEGFAQMNTALVETAPQLQHLTLGLNVPFAAPTSFGAVYAKALQNLRAIAPNLKDFKIDSKIVIEENPTEKIRLLSEAIRALIAAAAANRINMAREYIQIELVFVGNFPPPSAYERFMKQKNVDLTPPYRLEYYEGDVLVRVQADWTASRRRLRSKRRRTARRRII